MENHKANTTSITKQTQHQLTKKRMSFSEKYLAFQTAQTEALKGAPSRQQGESAPAYFLRLAISHYQPHHWVNDSDVYARFRAARQAGRALLGESLKRTDLLPREKNELANIYIFIAPLDAINWKRMKNLNTEIKDWVDVKAFNQHAGDMTHDFYSIMSVSRSDYPAEYGDVYVEGQSALWGEVNKPKKE